MNTRVKFSAMSVALACAIGLVRPAAQSADSQQTLPKLSYQECVDIGSEISINDANLAGYQQSLTDERNPARQRELRQQIDLLVKDNDELKRKLPQCVGVTIETAPQPQTKLPGGAGARTIEITPSAPQGPKLPYQECVTIGSDISIKQGEVDGLRRMDVRTASQAATVRTRLAALNQEIVALKQREQAGCAGVTLPADGTPPPTNTPPTTGVKVNPLCEERYTSLLQLQFASGDTSLSAIRDRIRELQEEISIRERLLGGDVSASNRTEIEQRIRAARTQLSARQTEETQITGRMDRLRQELESLGCDPRTGKPVDRPRPTTAAGTGAPAGGTGTGATGGASDPGRRDTRFTGTFQLWVEYSVTQPETQIGTLTLRDISKDRGRRRAVEQVGTRALVDLPKCGKGTPGARTIVDDNEYYEGEIKWIPESPFIVGLNRRPSTTTPMVDAVVVGCSSWHEPSRIDIVFSGTERRGGFFSLIRKGGFLKDTMYFDKSSATNTLFVRAQ